MGKTIDLNHLVRESLTSACSTLAGDQRERVNGLLRGVATVVAYHGGTRKVLDSMCVQLAAFLAVEDEATFVKRAKYVLAMPMAKFLRDSLPECPEGFDGFHGPWRRWAKSRLIAYNRKNVHLWFSFMQCKRSCLPLSDKIVRETYLKHRTQMGRPDPLENNRGMLDRMLSLVRPFISKIKAGLTRLTQDEIWNLGHKASQNASWESSRKEGGQTEALAARVFEAANPGRDSSRRFTPGSSAVLESMEWSPYGASSVTKPIQAGRKWDKVKVPAVLSNRTDTKYGELENREIFESRLRDWAQADLAAHNGRLPAMIQAVLEPLKVRVISKGPAAPYFFSKGLQKALHDIMRKMPCFRLIGRPVSPTDLLDIARRGENWLWYSGDYVASTDNLSALLGNAIFAELIEDLDDWDSDIYRAVLAPHTCHYPPMNGFEDIPSIEQANGQLMGSVLSFPVLCLANLALYLSVVAEPNASDKDLIALSKMVLINGDDILYCATREQTIVHAANGKEIGLEMSVGKTYAHKRYANINSTSFDLDLSCTDSQPVQIDFLNTGLYFGQNKVLGRVGVDMEDPEVAQAPHCAVINALLQGALPGRQSQVLRSYLCLHKAAISEETKGRNLFAAQSLGGMGVRRPADFKANYTFLQRVISTVLYNAMKVDAEPAVLPLLSRPVAAPVLRYEAWTYVQADLDPYELPRFARKVSKLSRFHGMRLISETLMEIGVMLVAPRARSRPSYDVVERSFGDLWTELDYQLNLIVERMSPNQWQQYSNLVQGVADRDA